jgi:hypothetical protein
MNTTFDLSIDPFLCCLTGVTGNTWKVAPNIWAGWVES